MDKTIHANFIGKNNKSQTDMTGGEVVTSDILTLLQEMKGFLKEAANDLLQPRPEAVAKLLKKVHY